MNVARLLVALIVSATVAFVVGVALERHEVNEPARGSVTTHREVPSEHAGESGAGEVAERREQTGGHEARESSETLLGVNPESTALVAAAVALSLALAIAAWRMSGTMWVLAAVALAMAAFGALDVREALHQASESRAGLTALASAVAALHLGAALVAAGAAARAGRPRLTPPTRAT